MNLQNLPPLRMLWAVMAVAALSGCDLNPFSSESSDPLLSKEAIATREASASHVFQGQLDGQPTFLLLHDCEVQRVERRDGGGVQWTRVLAPDFYPFWTVCQRESMSVKDGIITVELGRMAIGAGGCCATGGTYQSRDGRNWKKR